ncbi:MAG: flagellar protein FlgN [Proteobacteria bacterium]|nr:flagellar protein FlgN [Pseudomonadota bacterium]
MKTEEMLEQLLGVLSRETELYQAMSTVMNKEKDATIQSELIALNETQIEKENILVALGLLEGQRRNIVTSLADTLGFPARDMNLTKISQLVGEPFAGRLKQARFDLSALLESVQAANQRNRHLFEHSRELLRGSFNLLSELKAPNPIYYRTGAIQNTSVSGKCVCDKI